jgi:gas vesicle protein
MQYLLRLLLNRLRALFPGMFAKIQAAYDFIFHAKTAFGDLFSSVQSLITDVENEIDQIKHFDVNPHWRNRVISVPTAIENIQRFPELFTTIADAVKDLVSQIKEKVSTAPEVNPDELQMLPEKFAQFGEKIAAWLGMFLDALVTIKQAVNDLHIIVDSIREIREDLENLDGLFLTQKNPRRYVTGRHRTRIS